MRNEATESVAVEELLSSRGRREAISVKSNGRIEVNEEKEKIKFW